MCGSPLSRGSSEETQRLFAPASLHRLTLSSTPPPTVGGIGGGCAGHLCSFFFSHCSAVLNSIACARSSLFRMSFFSSLKKNHFESGAPSFRLRGKSNPVGGGIMRYQPTSASAAAWRQFTIATSIAESRSLSLESALQWFLGPGQRRQEHALLLPPRHLTLASVG